MYERQGFLGSQAPVPTSVILGYNSYEALLKTDLMTEEPTCINQVYLVLAL